MLEPAALSTFYPVVMTPSHDGRFFMNYVTSLLNFTSECARVGMRVQAYFNQGDSLVTRARNNCVADFLANPEWTHLFWIDSDIGFSAEAAFRLLLSDYDISGGVYPLKREFFPESGEMPAMTKAQFDAQTSRYTVNTRPEVEGGPVDLVVQPDGFLKLDELPTGFMCIKRVVFERMVEAFPELQYMSDSPGVANRGLHYRFFDVMVDPETRRYLSEDYGFCRLWQQLGGSIYADANSNLTHSGSKMFTGNFAASLQTALAHAVGAPEASLLRLHGAEFLRPNAMGG